MSKSSTVTVRERPVENVASAQAGALTIHGETIVVQTDQRIELVDLTNRVMEYVRRFNIREGFVSLWSMHTTCALFINEFQVALLADIKRFLEQMVARDAEWMHNDPQHSDCDRMNADSHLRAVLLGQLLDAFLNVLSGVVDRLARLLRGSLLVASDARERERGDEAGDGGSSAPMHSSPPLCGCNHAVAK